MAIKRKSERGDVGAATDRMIDDLVSVLTLVGFDKFHFDDDGDDIDVKGSGHLNPLAAAHFGEMLHAFLAEAGTSAKMVVSDVAAKEPSPGA